METDNSTTVEKTWAPLIDGMQYLGFQPLLAKEIGVNETLFLNHIHNWLQVSKNKRDGFIWVYKTYDEWQAELPFWSVDTVKRTIKKLEKAELVISTGKYNRLGFDKTKWYTINYEKINLLNMELQSGQNAQTDDADCTDNNSKMHRGTEQFATSHDNKLHKQSGQNAQTDDSKLPQTIPLNNTLNNSLNQSNNTFIIKQEEKTDRQSFHASSISNSVDREREEKKKEKTVVGQSLSRNEQIVSIEKAIQFTFDNVDEQVYKEIPGWLVYSDYDSIMTVLQETAQLEEIPNKLSSHILNMLNERKKQGSTAMSG
ncbi:hypothetical protein [Bacillus sp. RS11]|uniref:hypothetical protein n=1 Tax=Lysinibacillus sp. RS11 TaxID=3242682 RepID=UPI0035C75739